MSRFRSSRNAEEFIHALVYVVNHGESRWWFPRAIMPSETHGCRCVGYEMNHEDTLIRSESG